METYDGNSKNKSNDYSKEELNTILKMFIFSSLGILVFFIPININNQFETLVYHISYYIENRISSLVEIYIIFFVVIFSIKDTLSKEKSNIYNFKICAKLFSIVILVSFFMKREDLFISDDKFIFILRDIITSISILLPVCSVFLPLLLEYGLVEVIESYTNKFMKKSFKVSGKVFLNILIYVFVDYICGLFVTYKLYRDGKLREKEACITVLNFSILSFDLTSYLCYKINIKTFNFIILQIVTIIICNIIICRIYPLSKKKQSYFIKSRYKEVNCKRNKLKTAIKKYLNNKSRSSVFSYSKSYLCEVISIFINLIPNIIIIFCLGSIIFNLPFMVENINNMYNILIKIIGVTNYPHITEVISRSFFNNILGIKYISQNTYFFTNITISIIISLQCINISILVPFIMKSIIPLRFGEVMLVYIERLFIILTLSCISYYIYLNYII